MMLAEEKTKQRYFSESNNEEKKYKTNRKNKKIIESD